MKRVSPMILVVDDEKNIREGLKKNLELEGYDVLTAVNGNDAIKRIEGGGIDLVLSDLRMSNGSGEVLLQKTLKMYPDIPVILMTGHGTVETAVKAMHQGAYDFLTKPIDVDRLILLIKRALKSRKLNLENQHLQQQNQELKERQEPTSLIGNSATMQEMVETIRQIAPSKASILITGESGVGKEVAVNTIHQLSNRREEPLVKVHCAALSESLLESELFGHESGSFTGAERQKKGRFELADKGTIFLDEIGEISQSVQVKILRVLQERQFERVGGETPISVDVRVLAATNRDLAEEIRLGNFREDLYYRLNVVTLSIPSLREHKEDIPLLATRFLKEFAQENEKEITSLSEEVIRILYNYDWPGNIRELRNCIESSVVMCRGDTITKEVLPPQFQEVPVGDVDILIPSGSSLAEAERILIETTLLKTKNRKSRAAEILGIGRKTLYRKLHEYGYSEKEEG